MLTIKDLNTSKKLDSKEMASVTGGYGYGMPAGIELNIASPVNAPKQASLAGFASSFTGPQINTNMQSDNDFNSVIGSGQVVSTGGNNNSTAQFAESGASNFLTNIQ